MSRSGSFDTYDRVAYNDGGILPLLNHILKDCFDNDTGA